MKALFFAAFARCPRTLGRPLLGLLLLVAAVQVAAAAEPLRYGQGLLWRIETQGAPPSYLFGTMHSTDPAVLSLPDPVKQAFGEARSLALEMVIDQAVQQQLGQAMVLNDGRSLDGIIGQQRFSAVTEVGAKYGLPPQALRVFRPWAAMSVFSMTPTEFQRNSAGILPLDQALQAAAGQRGMPVHGLETVEEQIAVFADIPEPEQIQLLDLVLRDHPEIERWYDRIKRAYLAGDVADIYSLMTEQTEGAPASVAESFEDRLILERNERMARRMAPLLNQGLVFVAVGALHLPGERGILRLLEIEGRQVTRIY
ncbi:MAG: TraB/GumN family protein [Kiloniellales bacterium]